MLESAVARLLNGLLGKYVVDLDTENLNVGIFSGQVQLTDLKLKPEALYELNLPIEVHAGTIGSLRLRIPWTALWSQPVHVIVDDVHIVTRPVNDAQPHNADTDRRLRRALTRYLLDNLDSKLRAAAAEGSGSTGGGRFADCLLTRLVHNLTLTVNGVHVRYVDVGSTTPLVAGLCIGMISAEATNSKWKPCDSLRNQDTSYYLVKLDGLCIYWNSESVPDVWDFPSQYYQWRNSMTDSLKKFMLTDGTPFDFLLKPMTTKLKMTVTRTPTGAESGARSSVRVLHDIVVHDVTLQLTKRQYDSMSRVCDSLARMRRSWPHLAHRPHASGPPAVTRRWWWRYACHVVIEERVRPFTWCRLRTVRATYRQYRDAYARLLRNPHDAELRLDVQQLEDRLSLVNIIIARQAAKLMSQLPNQTDKSFWDLLPSPERAILCNQLGINLNDDATSRSCIDHTYNFRIGNTSVTLLDDLGRELCVLTMTQLISALHPGTLDRCTGSLKVEALIVEVADNQDQMVPVLSSEINGHDRPAYFMKLEFEKTADDAANTPAKDAAPYKVSFVLEYLEVTYDKSAHDKIESFLLNNVHTRRNCYGSLRRKLNRTSKYVAKNLFDRCDLTLDIKIPYLVLPQMGSITNGEHILIVDLGRVKMTSELCLDVQRLEGATQMELEEKLYSRYHMDCSGLQILFTENTDGWRACRKERDTVAHALSKVNFVATYAKCVQEMKTLPKNKINFAVPLVKFNLFERRMIAFLKYYDSFSRFHSSSFADSNNNDCIHEWTNEFVLGTKYLSSVQAGVVVGNDPNLLKSRDKNARKRNHNDNSSCEIRIKENINEVWARCVDLPGLEDNISPSNNISTILQISVNDFQLVFNKSGDCSDRQYLLLRLGFFTMDLAWMTYGPALQVTLNNLLLTDKLHTTSSGQYLDLVYTPLPSKTDVLSILYRKVAANCPDFWSHFHGVETSLVADFGTINIILHQESVHTLIKYTCYFKQKLLCNTTSRLMSHVKSLKNLLDSWIFGASGERALLVPVPPGAIKFSQSARLGALNVRVCDADYEIVIVRFAEFEVDFLFRANERFVFRSFLSNIQVEHLSEDTLYTKVLTTDQDKVFEIKYVKLASNTVGVNNLSPICDDTGKHADGTIKFQLGQLHITFIYKLLVQLQRFVINLEALQYVRRFCKYLYKNVSDATASLTSTAKMNMAISVKGPALLFPQKSLSPNLIIVDTGNLSVENFFKESSGQRVENILLKLNDITVSRGVMMLTTALQFQETIIEAVNVHVDIKRSVANSDSFCWEIDGFVDPIIITLGQRDVTTLMAISTDNIGEGHVSELFPFAAHDENIYDSSSNTDSDGDTAVVRTLEAFFGEPRQKVVSSKFSFEGIHLSLFFDSGELLSSPIRDLNHGLCKFEMNSVQIACAIFADRSLEGKLTVETLQLDEIGPEANNFDRRILYVPADRQPRQQSDEAVSGQAHITVCRPPIVDVTWHRTTSARITAAATSDHRSVDVIVGRLRLCIGVPFCEQVALFITECLQRDDTDHHPPGIVNHGYVADQHNQQHSNKDDYHGDDDEEEHYDDHYYNRRPGSNFTVAVRINKPSLIFRVETASNRNVYFQTRAEILADYSRQQRYDVSWTISLSGLYSRLHDEEKPDCCGTLTRTAASSSVGGAAASTSHRRPYVVLKPCDVELSQNSCRAKGERLHFTVSAVQVTINQRVFHALSDILNDIAENFKAPPVLQTTVVAGADDAAIGALCAGDVADDVWEQRMMSTAMPATTCTVGASNMIVDEDFRPPLVPGPGSSTHPPQSQNSRRQAFIVPKIEALLLLELDDRPVVVLRGNLEAAVYDWSSLVQASCDLCVQTNYFNESRQLWEPLLEPIVLENNQLQSGGGRGGIGAYRPWECSIKIFQDHAVPIFCETELRDRSDDPGTRKRTTSSTDEDNGSDHVDNDDNPNGTAAMTFVEPRSIPLRSRGATGASSLVVLDDSDSEGEDGGVAKLTSTISELFTTGDWHTHNPSNNASEADQSSGDDDNDDEDNDDGRTAEQSSNNKHADFKRASFVLIDARDPLNLTLTPALVKVVQELVTSYSSKSLTTVSATARCTDVVLVNDIGPQSRIELFERMSDEDGSAQAQETLLGYKVFEKEEESCPNSPTKEFSSGDFVDDDEDEEDKMSDGHDEYDDQSEKDIHSDTMTTAAEFEAIESLDFPAATPADLYDIVNHYLARIHIPDFASVQTHCPRRAFRKLVRMQSNSKSLLYHLIADHRFNKYGWALTLSSPLQIRNETCFALCVLYQPSVLQQLGLEPVGDVTNPFATTMRIAVLEPHEIYNVPIHIAYHCKLFLQPAYVDGHHTSTRGIWWQDHRNDLDAVHNIVCPPRSTTGSSTSNCIKPPNPNLISNQSEQSHVDVFSLRVRLERNLTTPSSTVATIPNYVIHLLPPLVLVNFLPFIVEVELPSLQQQQRQCITIEPGDRNSVYSLDLGGDHKLVVRVRTVSETWCGTVHLTAHLDEKLVHLVHGDGGGTVGGQPMALNVRVCRMGSVTVFLSAPYWIVNKTGLPVDLKTAPQNQIYHTSDDDILLFSHRRQAHGKQTLSVRVYDSDWSPDFVLDGAAGNATSGVVVCRNAERRKRYSVLVTVKPARMCPKFSRIVTLLPQFLVENKTSRPIRFMEHNDKTDLWTDLLPCQCMTFWPDTGSMQMYVKWRDSRSASASFPFDQIQRTVLKMDKTGALAVDVSGGVTSPFLVTFRSYVGGDAPLAIHNLCADMYLKMQQYATKGGDTVTLLNPNKSMLYTWDDPAVAPRLLTWNVYGNRQTPFVLDIFKDCFGEKRLHLPKVVPTGGSGTTPVLVLPTADSSSVIKGGSQHNSNSSEADAGSEFSGGSQKSSSQVIVYWLCCRSEHATRALYVTQHLDTWRQLLTARLLRTATWELLLTLPAVHLSIFTAESGHKEHVTVSISDAPALWEVNVGGHDAAWKPLSLELATWLEQRYRHCGRGKCHLKDYLHVDFARMYMLKPVFAELRRSYNAAVYAQWRLATASTAGEAPLSLVHIQIQTVQVDNKCATSDKAILLQSIPRDDQEPQISKRLSTADQKRQQHEATLASSTSQLTAAISLRVTSSGESCVGSRWYRDVVLRSSDWYAHVQPDVVRDVVGLVIGLTRRARGAGSSGGAATVAPAVHFRRDLLEVRTPATRTKNKDYRALNVIERLTINDFSVHLRLSNRYASVYNPHTRNVALLDYLFPMHLAPYSPSDTIEHKIRGVSQACTNYTSLKELLRIHIFAQFLQQYYSQVLGLQVLVNSSLSRNSSDADNQASSTKLNRFTSDLLFGCRCLLGHVNMSWAALEQYILEMFACQSVDNIQRMRRQSVHYEPPALGSGQDQSPTLALLQTFNPAVVLAMNQIIAKNYNGFVSDSEDFLRGPEKSILSLVARYMDSQDRMNCVEVTMDALRRAVTLGMPIKMQQRLIRYSNNYLGLLPLESYSSLGNHLMEIVANGRFAKDRYWSFGLVDWAENAIIIITLEHLIRINKYRLWGQWELEWTLDLDEIISVPKTTTNEFVINIRQGEHDGLITDGKLILKGDKRLLTWLREKLEEAIVISMDDKSWTVTTAP